MAQLAYPLLALPKSSRCTGDDLSMTAGMPNVMVANSWCLTRCCCGNTPCPPQSRCSYCQTVSPGHHIHLWAVAVGSLRTTSGSREQTIWSTFHQCKHICTDPDNIHKYSCLRSCWILCVKKFRFIHGQKFLLF